MVTTHRIAANRSATLGERALEFNEIFSITNLPSFRFWQSHQEAAQGKVAAGRGEKRMTIFELLSLEANSFRRSSIQATRSTDLLVPGKTRSRTRRQG
jgi:hypothetical protein